MKTDKEILDEFGEVIVSDILDRHYSGVRQAINEGLRFPPRNIYNQVFDKLNENEKTLLSNFFNEIINSVAFDFLGLFEENEQFKVSYEKNNQKVDLVKASEMLKSELLAENGWIARFSKELKK